MADASLTPAGRAGLRRRPLRGLLALAMLVSLVHAWLVGELGERLGRAGASAPPVRLEAVYARQIVPQAPPPAAEAPPAPPVKPAPPRAVQAAPVAAPASAPGEDEATEYETKEEVAAEPPPVLEEEPLALPEATPMAEAAEVPAPGAPATEEAAHAAEAEAPALPAQADAAAPPGPEASAAATTAAPESVPGQGGTARPGGFAWPPSTRMSYTLTGNYRGEVHGRAQVEWIKAGDRYQVHLDVIVGPPFAPLIARRMSSDGLITPEGLVPQRYDEVTRTGLRTRQATVRLTPQTVTLANGTEVPAQPGVQDTASQFVQLTQRFMRDPALLRPGASLGFPLALPRHMHPWVYEVQAPERLATPFGEVEVFPLKPRRPDKAGRALMVDLWYAPALQYLPVRILIRQDESTYVDLMIEKLPEQAAPEAQPSAVVSTDPGSGP